ncbi:MAG: hypothetical protein GY841_14840 [FCB group bacterium]|nr:hypothetical protein [FCB group bacterium]
MFKKLFLWILLIVVFGIVTIYVARNTLVERAVEEGSTYALGVETDLGSASLDMKAGSVELDNLAVSNPDGFEGGHFLTMKSGILAIETGSVFDDEIVVDSLILEGINLSFEQIDGKGNYAAILNHLKQLDFGSSESDQNIKIKLASIRDIEVGAVLNLLGQKKFEKSFAVENITLRNIGGDNGASLEKITAEIMQTIISKAASAGQNQFPDLFKANVSRMAEDKLEEVKTEAADKLKDAAGSLLGGDK